MLLDLFNGSDPRATIIQMLLSLPVFLLSLSFHEAAHAYAAYRCGDPTARMLGRMTLNPIKHIDPIGLVLMFIARFGWAKPVPVNPRNFRNYRRDDFIVSIAGITANLMLFVVSLLLMYGILLFGLRQLGPLPGDQASMLLRFAYGLQDMLIVPTLGQAMGYVYQMIVQLAMTNLVLACFNLLPVPPLDGYHLFNDLFFKQRLFAPEMVSRFGFMLLLVLSWTGLISKGLNFVIIHTFEGVGTLMYALFSALKLL